MEEPGRLQSTGFQSVGRDWATSLSLHQLLISWEYQDLGLYGHFAGAILRLILWSYTKTKLSIEKQKQTNKKTECQFHEISVVLEIAPVFS